MDFLKVKNQKFDIDKILVLRKYEDTHAIILIDTKDRHFFKYDSEIETSLIFFIIWEKLKKYGFNKNDANIFNLNHIANTLQTEEKYGIFRN